MIVMILMMKRLKANSCLSPVCIICGWTIDRKAPYLFCCSCSSSGRQCVGSHMPSRRLDSVRSLFVVVCLDECPVRPAISVLESQLCLHVPPFESAASQRWSAPWPCEPGGAGLAARVAGITQGTRQGGLSRIDYGFRVGDAESWQGVSRCSVSDVILSSSSPIC